MNTISNLRVAWLFPSLAFANYWHPILSQFAEVYRQTIVYTGDWYGYSSGFENKFAVQIVGKMKFVDTTKSKAGYQQGFIYASPNIIRYLLQFKPHVIYATGFSIWTIFSLLLKPIGRWRVVIAYEGSAPGVDYRNSPVRLFLRRLMACFTDAFITNSRAGKDYLSQILGVDENAIFTQPYQVPDTKALLQNEQGIELGDSQIKHPIFLFSGQVISRKGLQYLLEACRILHAQDCHNYTLLVAGDGSQRDELEAFCIQHGLQDCVKWLGWVSYAQLGNYFRSADVFILSSLEDTWGMVVLESMAFGKPVLCSQWAGASEMVIDGKNGYRFDPYRPEAIAALMRQFIDDPELSTRMGRQSKAIIARYTPETAVQFLAKVTHLIGSLAVQ